MRTHALRAGALAAAVAAALLTGPRLAGQAGHWVVIGWNNLGMHCLDADFSLFSLLPPFNSIQAQVIDPAGHLVTGSSVRVVYRAAADPTGSINRTSVGKTNFWQYAPALFGLVFPGDRGLTGAAMPGTTNADQPLPFDPAFDWYGIEGIPITPYDDTGSKNTYPLMEMRVLSAGGQTLASTVNTLPVSDEMDCSTCHASGSDVAARPSSGWAFDPDPQRDYRLNILLLHDDRQQGDTTYQAALAARGLSKGLYRSAVEDVKPAMCATCHLSNALPGSGYPGIGALTASIHTMHAGVTDPGTGMTLDDSNNRSACYRCHPGSVTRCLRGTMGNTVAADGSMAIQCQNCHGPMRAVGNASRVGWLDEPTCQQCHTGTAVQNGGAIRFTSALLPDGSPRPVVNPIFATEPDAPASGLSLYRFSAGHGGLQCAACHGSTHAEYPASHANDNLQSVALQGHAGTLGECNACHTASVPTQTAGGPHGMHPVGPRWVQDHHDVAERDPVPCRDCHGANYRGTELSRTFSARTMFNRAFFKGQQVGCYTCHRGPTSDDTNPNRAPVATSLNVATAQDVPVPLTLTATDADGNTLTYRIVSQPANGTVGLNGTAATYYPFDAFTGNDTFTYAAWDGSTDSNLATVTVTVDAPVPPPTPAITSVVALSNPFRIRIDGKHFSRGAAVSIGTDRTPWPSVSWVGSDRLILDGLALGGKYPAGRAVTIRIVNPDGGSAMTTYRRRSR
ncbi:MAG: Ig-like domain-containing protein [Vicinamibacterales bacterium]